jgi:hypothetical protein
MGACLDSVCDSNIDTSCHISIESLVGKTLELSLRLERWRNDALPFTIVTSETDMDSWSAGMFNAQRKTILLSICYYRTVLLIHGTLLLTVLEIATSTSHIGLPPVLQDAVRSLLRSDFDAVREFGNLIRALLSHNPAFFKRNAAWWTCNYACSWVDA